MKNQFLLAGLLLSVLVGCTREQEPQEPAGRYPAITLTATISDSKTSLGESEGTTTPVLWNADDQLWVRSAAQEAGTPGNLFSTSESAITNGGRQASFTGEAPTDGPYVALYPYSVVSNSSTNTEIVFVLKNEQTYVPGSFDPASNVTAAAWASGTVFSMSNLFGLLHIKLTGTSKVKKLVISDNNPQYKLWGNCRLAVNQDNSTVGDVQISNTETGANTLTLTCPEAVTLSEEATSFYFVVPAGAFAKGFTCVLYDTNNAPIKSLTTETDCKIVRGRISDMQAINPESVLFSGGEGTKANPWRIATPADIQQMGELINGASSSEYTSGYYRQIRDINLQDTAFECIGKQSATPFKGNYDGGGFTLGNLSPTPASGAAAGLFGYTDGATISNLNIDGYTNNGTAGNQGVIVGYSKSTAISGVHINAVVDFAKCACGGVAGYVDGGSISDCSVEGFIHNEDTDTFQGVTVVSCVGGIAGYLGNASIKNCTFKGNVTSKGEQLGGIVGQISQGTVENCQVLAGSTVTGDNYYVGGIAGEMLKGGTIKGCEVQADIICWYPGAGGIVAWLQNGDVRDCVVGSLSTIRSGMDQAGGIAAYVYWKDNAQTVNIDNCAVYAKTVAANYSVGGIVGEFNPTSNSTVMNVSNCAFIGGELINAGYAKSGWTMIAGIVAWARMGSTTSTLNIVNCISDPSVIRADFPQGTEADLAGFIGEQGGTNASVNILGSYTTLAKGRAVINGQREPSSEYFNYAALVGLVNKTNFDHVYYINSLPALGKANSGTSTECLALPGKSMTDGTLLSYLNAFKNSYSGPLTLRSWVSGPNGYPVFDGIAANPSTGKKKALRVSLIGDSLSTFDGYAPHGYHSSKAPNGYRCHYPTGDGNVTSAAQTYWYILTYELLSNAVWDTNLAFSGTATTRCTNTSYSDKYWYGQDFCTRYIENAGMGSPDIIIINGGANDWAHGIYNILGSQKLERYPSTTPHRPSDSAMNAAYAVADAAKTMDEAKALPDGTFIEAYLKLIRMMSIQYPHVKIIVLIHDTLTPDVEESLLHIAGHYSNCRAVDLYAVNGFNDLGWNFEYLSKGYQPNMPKHDFDWSSITTSGDLRKNCSDHYSAQAMRFIAEKIYNELGSWLEDYSYNESGSGSIGNYDNINGAW